jgi:hypothetical protein
MPTTGIVLFAYNTSEINYVRLAIIAAKYAKQFMPGYPVCLITDQDTWDFYIENHAPLADDAPFDQHVLTDDGTTDNRRLHYDSPYSHFVSEFKNSNKHKVIKYTPYDRTMMIDIDYIIQNDSLAYVFDSDESVVMFHKAENLIGQPPAEPQQRLHPTGIDMLWSTVMYFDRTDPTAQMFFELWDHIQADYNFYQFLYGFPSGMYRTDFCVSIATHIMHGMAGGDVIGEFPAKMINMSQRDDIATINAADQWVYMVNDNVEQWKNSLTLIARENVHVMNKRALERHFDDIMIALDKEKV